MSSVSEEFSRAIRHDAFQACMVESLMVGIYTAIVLFSLHRIISQRRIKSVRGPLVLIVVMYLCAVVNLAKFWWTVSRAFIDHEQSGKSVLAALSTDSNAGLVISTVSRGALIFIGDAIMIWRCWNLYSRSWRIVTLPIFLLLGELVTLICRIIYRARSRSSARSSALSSAISVDMALAHASLTLATTVLVTFLIVFRIVHLGGGRRHRNIIEIIVESSALYAVAIIIYLPFTVHPALLNTIPNAVLTPMPGITSTLIIARVYLGRGIERDRDEETSATLAGARMTTLRFGRTSVSGQNAIRPEPRDDGDDDAILDLEVQVGTDGHGKV